MYNLFTVLNSAYMPFGKIWLNSLYEKTDIDMIKKIYILDTGLLPEDLEYLKKFAKVEIVLSDINIVNTSDALPKNSPWLQHVLRKTKYFRKVLRKDSTPLIMIDSDCMFINNFLKHIDNTKDVLVCNRSYHEHDNWIASFFVANKQKEGLVFMDLWIKEMKQLMREQPERGWFESHSLNLCLTRHKKCVIIGDVHTKNVACEEPTQFDDTTCILHFKGTSKKTNFNERINRFSSVIDLQQKLMDYIND
jgi:lipopolysaccharide biosynthesis glycosyltransferase